MRTYRTTTWTQVLDQYAKLWREHSPFNTGGVPRRPVRKVEPNAILHPDARPDGYKEAHPPSPFWARI